MDDSSPRLAEALDGVAAAITELADAAPAGATQLTPHTFLFRDQPPFMQRVNVVLDEYLAAELASSSDPVFSPEAGVLSGRTLKGVNLEDQLTGWVRLIVEVPKGKPLNLLVPFGRIAAIYLPGEGA